MKQDYSYIKAIITDYFPDFDVLDTKYNLVLTYQGVKVDLKYDPDLKFVEASVVKIPSEKSACGLSFVILYQHINDLEIILKSSLTALLENIKENYDFLTHCMFLYEKFGIFRREVISSKNGRLKCNFSVSYGSIRKVELTPTGYKHDGKKYKYASLKKFANVLKI